MSNYNYDEFSTDDYDLDTQSGPDLGDKAPDFQLATTEGVTKNLLDFAGDFLVLEMGSITCPLYQSRREIMETLDQQPNVSSAVLYVREAHPGADIQAHKTMADKIANAVRLKTEDGETRTVFIDDLEGRVHVAYGSKPNAVYIIDKTGIVVFRSDWNNAASTQKALQALVAGDEIHTKSYFHPPRPTAVVRTLGKAGKGAAVDFFRGLPVLIWNNIIKRSIRLFFKRR